jgi:lysophospholipase L1-like esterase
MKKILLLTGILVIFGSWTPERITWVAIGDSITYLNDHPDETKHRISKGYLSIVTERFPGITYINQGHNGWTSVRMAEQIEAIGLVEADVYSVFLGTNDWWAGVPVGSLEDYRQNTGAGSMCGAFRVITDKIKSLNDQAMIILITPMQRGDFVYINDFSNHAYGSYREKNGQHLEEFANAILAIAKLEDLPVVDLYHDSGIVQDNMVRFKRLKNPDTGDYTDYPYPDYIGVPFDPRTDEYPYPVKAMDMTYDGLHPSDTGHSVIANMLISKWKGISQWSGTEASGSEESGSAH